MTHLSGFPTGVEDMGEGSLKFDGGGGGGVVEGGGGGGGGGLSQYMEEHRWGSLKRC